MGVNSKDIYNKYNLFYTTAMEGNLETIMAGLNCGTPSEYGWRILKKSAHAFLSCEDEITVTGMKQLYFPTGIRQ